MLVGSDFIAHQFPCAVNRYGAFCFTVGNHQSDEYRGHYDLSVVVSILSRLALGLLYLSDVTVINDRVIAIRFALTMLFAAEVMRQGSKTRRQKVRASVTPSTDNWAGVIALILFVIKSLWDIYREKNKPKIDNAQANNTQAQAALSEAQADKIKAEIQRDDYRRLPTTKTRL